MFDEYSLRLNALAQECHQISRDHGFWDAWTLAEPDADGNRFNPRAISEKLALVHSEVSEALEEYRKAEDWKATLPSELADVIIRAVELAAAFDLDIDGAVREKVEKNRSRPYLHGGRRC